MSVEIVERYCANRTLLAAATGLSKWQLKGMYRVTRDTPECPFSAGGRGGYPSRVLAWHRDHIDFSADRVLKNLGPKCTLTDRRSVASGKFGAPLDSHDSQSASPVVPAPRRERVA